MMSRHVAWATEKVLVTFIVRRKVEEEQVWRRW